MQYAKMLEPFHSKKLSLRNHIVMGPMGTGMTQNHIPTQQMADYYGARAKGGVGLVIVEHTPTQNVGLWGKGAGAIYKQESIPGYKKVVDAVHAGGAKVAVQLGNAGNTGSKALLGLDQISASAYRCHTVQEEVRAVTLEQIEQFKQDYLQSVKNAVEAGFDAIELHLTNGYFFASFISGRTNRRTDEYGGTFEGRMKLPIDIIHMIRREIGPDLPLLARVSVCEVNRGRSVEESRLVVCALQDAGVDMIDMNIGSMCEFEYEFPPYAKQQGFALSEMEDLRRSLDIPVIAGSRVTEPAMAEQILRDDRADLVYVNRQHIADPEWIKKAAGGQTALIRRCIGCTRCLDAIATPGMQLVCSVNPFVGHESDWAVQTLEQRRRAVVVGGGPAGLQAASIFAQQGHETILLEKDSSFGGMAKAASMPPMKWEIAGFISSLVNECKKYGVDMRLGTEATTETVKALNPDKLILATGAEHVLPPIDGIDNACVIRAVDLLEGRAWVGQKVAVVGGGSVGCDVSDFLTDYHRDITIFEILNEIGADLWQAPRIEIIGHLKQYGVAINTACTIQSVSKDGKLRYISGEKEYTEQFDTVVLAAGMQSVNKLEGELSGQGIEIFVVGDAKQPRRFHESLVDAVKCALTLGNR